MVTTRSQTRAARYEFLGPPGVSLMTLGLPFLCYLTAFVCNDVSGCPAPSTLHPSTLTLAKLKKEVAWPGFVGLLNTQSFVAVLGYYALSLVLWRVLPAQEVEGSELRSGGKLKYRLNTFASTTLCLSIAAAGTALQGVEFPLWPFMWDNYIQILTSNVIISFTLAVFVYIRSFSVHRGNREKRELAEGGHTGNLVYDWFIGRELNPPVTIPLIGKIDIKSFMELRPGMLGWVLLDLAFMAKQYHNYGFITDSMLITVISQSLYVLDAQYMESAILTTMDITTDGFGFMLAFGDLVWLPFTYSWQARYLSVHPVQLGLNGCLAVFAVAGVGYYIFRSANNQKNRFRSNPKDPKVAHLESMATRTGSRLLLSGWWGASRHINYLGDWIMSWAYCLPTGIAGYIVQPSSPFSFRAPSDGAKIRDDHSLRGGVEVVPGEARGWGMLFTYFFMLYFAVLLIHRERRDDKKCREKYGSDWTTYTRRVRWRIVPYVY